ncbi:unnamed protein product, partial [Larinioides sclopetarius]
SLLLIFSAPYRQKKYFADKYPKEKIDSLFDICQRSKRVLLQEDFVFISECGDFMMEREKEIARSPLFVAKGVLLSISFFAGIFGVFFCIWKHNHYGTTSFLFLKMVSVLLLQLNVKYMKGKLFLQFTANNLKFLLIFGCAMFLMSLAFSVFLLVMGVKYETEFNFIYNNAYFAFVPCLVSNFWFVVLVYDVWNFMKLREEQNGAPSSIR